MSDFLSAGRLEDHPFADLVGLIFRESRSGELFLESAQRRRSVWFLGGNPVAVASADPQDHLAQVLLDHGKISAEDAQRLAALSETREALGSADFLPKETLNWGVKSRFINLCYDLFRWEEGDYAFREADPPRELFFLKVPAHSLVFKGVSFLRQATILEAIPDEATCNPGPVAAEEARYLAADARGYLERCRPGRTVAEVLDGAEDTDEARRMLYALSCLGLVTLTLAPVAAASPVRDEAPGFVLDEDGNYAIAAPAVAAQPAGETAPGPPAMPERKLDFGLPPTDAEPEPFAYPDAAAQPSDDTQPESGYPFEEDPTSASFSSFDFGPAPGEQDANKASTATDLEVSGDQPKKSGRRFHIPRLAGIALGAFAAVALIGAAGWWWMNGSAPPPPVVKPPVKRPVKVPPPAAPVPAAPVPPAAAPAPGPTAQPVAPAPTPQPPSAPLRPQTPLQTPAPAPGAPAATTAAAAPAAPGTDRYRNALEVFSAGDIDGAAAIWETLLAEEHRGAFTLLLMTACQRQTIRDAQRELSAQQLYLLTKKVNGRGCFRVCLGTYDSRDAAGRALADLPPEYRSAGAAVRPVADVLNRDR